jgi:hypothetical protein
MKKFKIKKSREEKTLNISVIHGSMLGPILFLIYINDLYNASALLKLMLLHTLRWNWQQSQSILRSVKNMYSPIKISQNTLLPTIPQSSHLCSPNLFICWTFHFLISNYHSWASALRKLTPASTFRHQSFQSSTGPKKCRIALAWSGTGHFPASLVFSFWYQTDQMPDSPAFWHLYTLTSTRTRTRTWTRTQTRTQKGTRTRTCTRTSTQTYDEQERTWTGTRTCRMDMKHGHGHASWTWRCTSTTDKKFSRASLVCR